MDLGVNIDPDRLPAFRPPNAHESPPAPVRRLVGRRVQLKQGGGA